MSSDGLLDHVTVTASDFERSRALFTAVLAELGLQPVSDWEDPEGESSDPDTVAALGFAVPGQPSRLWLVSGTQPTRNAHLALATSSPDVVRAAFASGVRSGGRPVQAPRDWEASQLGYYGAQLADGDGNLIEIVLRSADQGMAPRNADGSSPSSVGPVAAEASVRPT